MKTRGRLVIALVVTLAISVGWAQNKTKPLTDDDIIRMTKSGLGESTILAVVQASPANFDISPNALIAMKSAGVTQNVINAIVAGAANKSNSSPVTPPTAAPPVDTPDAAPGPHSWPPTAYAGQTTQPKSIIQLSPPAALVGPNTAAQPSQSKEPSVVLLPASAAPGSAAPQGAIVLPLEKAQLTQTKTKASSLGGLAGDSVTKQALESGANTAGTEGLLHSSSILGGAAAAQAGGFFGSVLSQHKTSVTYLWAVSGPSSPTQVPSNQPRFSVNFTGWMYVSLSEFEPAIVKLTPTPPPTAWRLVGASQGKENAFSSSAVDWQAFSNFLQDQAPAQVKKISPGVFEISASMPLEAGEYGIVLRPVSKTMKFSGADIARNQGNGKVFNSVWSFEVKQGEAIRD
jgi:hypothetical protein